MRFIMNMEIVNFALFILEHNKITQCADLTNAILSKLLTFQDFVITVVQDMKQINTNVNVYQSLVIKITPLQQLFVKVILCFHMMDKAVFWDIHKNHFILRSHLTHKDQLILKNLNIHMTQFTNQPTTLVIAIQSKS